MNTNRIGTEHEERVSTSLLRTCLSTCSDEVREAVESVRERITRQYQHLFRGQERLLKLALNEAEALAWQTDYPHLLFPTLAFEKAEAAAEWNRRQKTLRGHGESAFAA